LSWKCWRSLLVGAVADAQLSGSAQHRGASSPGSVAGYVSLPTAQYPDAARERRFYRALEDRLHALPDVQFAGIGTTLPLSGRRSERVFTPDDYTPPPGAEFNIAGMTVVSPEYLQAIGAPLLRGRYFTPQDGAAGQPVAIVTQALARQYWAGQDPIGKRLMWGGPQARRPWLTVVGDSDEADGLNRPGGLQVYVPADQVESSSSNTIEQLRSMFIVACAAAATTSRRCVARSGARIDPTGGRQPSASRGDARGISRATAVQHAADKWFRGRRAAARRDRDYGVVAYSVAQRTRKSAFASHSVPTPPLLSG
jgi:putative ABC transport system permease protein